MSLETNILILAVLILLSAFFSSTETAMFSLSHIKARYLLEQKKKGAKTLNKLKDNSQRLLITILIGNNVVNIGASAFATSIAIGFLKNNAVGIVTGVMTLILLTFGEIIPKSIATKHNESISLVVAKPILVLQTILFPLVVIFELMTNKLTGKVKKPLVTEKELIAAVNIGEKEGEINEAEREMIHRIFKFNDIPVEKVMTPLPDIASVNAKAKIKDIIKTLLNKPYSRIPVYKKQEHNIIGILFLRDVMKAMTKKKNHKSVKTIMQKPLFVPDTKKIDSMLRFFQNHKQHMAIVVDEYGAVRGLVTIEDVLEEIVGEILDETDKIEPLFVKLSRNSYLVKGNRDIEELNKKFKLGIKSKNFDTVSGYITSTLGKIPKHGEKINRKKFAFIVKEVGQKRVTSVKLIVRKI